MVRPLARKSGFTLVELMVLIGILGLLFAVAVPSFNGYMRANRIDVTVDEIAADMALARATAIADGRVLQFSGTATGYTITDTSDGRVIRNRRFAGAVRLLADTTVNFFPWGAADTSTLSLDNGCDTRKLQVLPTGLVEVGS